MRLPSWLAQHLAALRALLVFTVLLGLAYPLAMVGGRPAARPRDQRRRLAGHRRRRPPVGSRLIGQAFTDADGNPVPQYFQSRPSAAGDGYDPTSTAASNLGPESVVDTLADDPDDASAEPAHPGLRPQPGGRRAGGRRRRAGRTAPPTASARCCGVFHRDGLTGPVTRAVSVNQACPATPFVATYEGVPVECAQARRGLRRGGVLTPIRGDAPGRPGRARRRGHRQRQRPRPAHQPRVRRAAGRPGRPGARHRRRRGASAGRASTPPAGRSASWASPGSTCCELNLALDRAVPG